MLRFSVKEAGTIICTKAPPTTKNYFTRDFPPLSIEFILYFMFASVLVQDTPFSFRSKHAKKK